MAKPHESWAARFVIAIIFTSVVREARANNGVTAESVNDYSYIAVQTGACSSSAPHCADTTCNSEGDGFYNTLVTAGWNGLRHYDDSSVFDTDFYDPDKSGSTYDNDTYNFDSAGNAFSFTCLHGKCDDITSTNCSSAADCPSGYECMNQPPDLYSTTRCAFSSGRRAVTSSATNHHGNYVWYSGGTVKWGEDSNSGNWAGAGTNGGDNVVFLVNSCSVRPYFWSEIAPVFAGIHMLAQIMVVNVNTAGFADAANWTGRGNYLANYAIANFGHPVGEAWFATMDAAPQSGYGACPHFDSNYTYGGGHGIIGCGAHLISSWDSTQALAQWHGNTESWLGAEVETNDATSSAYGWVYWHCNYDCNTYPFTK